MKNLFVICGIFAFCFFSAIETSAQNRKTVSGAEVTGTFRENSSGNEFNILALGKGKLRVAFSGLYRFKMANGKYMANTGEALGEAEIMGDTATFSPENTEECTITLKFFTLGRLKVTQTGTDTQCDFGVNVSADGNYRKVSGRKPRFQ